MKDIDDTSRVVVIAAHPDDEVLGCGGTIARLADRGARVRIAFLADGVSSREGELREQSRDLQERREAARRAMEILGAAEVTFGDFPDNRLDEVSLLTIVKAVEEVVASERPTLILTHHAGDVNIDHRRIHEAVVTAARPQGNSPVEGLLFFEVASSTEWQPPGSRPVFAPNLFVRIDDHLQRKLEALDMYAGELREWPHPRSRQGVESLARWRGATIGAAAAEAFIAGRVIL